MRPLSATGRRRSSREVSLTDATLAMSGIDWIGLGNDGIHRQDSYELYRVT
jgi:hypothetical protein